MNKEDLKHLTKTEKMKLLYEAKAEDVEFSAEVADQDDREARSRAAEADRRQLKALLHDEAGSEE